MTHLRFSRCPLKTIFSKIESEFLRQTKLLVMFGRKKKPSRPQEGQKKNDLSAMVLFFSFVSIETAGRIDADLLGDEDMENDEEDDEDLENNPELLAELQCIAPGDDGIEHQDPTPVMVPTVQALPNAQQDGKGTSADLNVLLEREGMYKQAIDNASKAGEGNKARRYGRGLKVYSIYTLLVSHSISFFFLIILTHTLYNTIFFLPVMKRFDCYWVKIIRLKKKKLQDLSSTMISFLCFAPLLGLEGTANKELSESQIPSSEKAKSVDLFTTRRNEYRIAALTCKKQGEIQQAKQFLAISKQIDSAIERLKNNEEVDVSQLPPVPTLPAPATGEISTSTEQSTAAPAEPQQGTSSGDGSGGESSAPKNLEPPPPPKDVAEALQQRLAKYQSGMDEAKKDGNSGKARRMGRIVKQYQDAIKSHKAGKPVAFGDLPTPPGYAPIPGVASPDDEGGDSAQTETQSSGTSQTTVPQVPTTSQLSGPPGAAAGSAPTRPTAPPSASIRKSPNRNEQQLKYLLERQKEFKMAAVQSKKRGDLEGAKNYLRMSKVGESKNFEKRRFAGVPPSPFAAASPAPSSEMDFEMVQAEDCDPNPPTPEETSELFSRLEDALIKQIEMCARNAHHYQKLGDITNTKKYVRFFFHFCECLQISTTMHCSRLEAHAQNRNGPPKLLTRITQHGPYAGQLWKTDYYINLCFQTEEPQTGRTQTAKHSINPDYNEVFKVNIDRKNRSLVRIFKRQPCKLEVKYERGFLKADKSLGQVPIKLSAFDNKCEIHECFDLMDTDRGRKAVGGKLEVRLRIREPVVDKDVKIEKWKWLVIDLHLTSRKMAALPRVSVHLFPCFYAKSVIYHSNRGGNFFLDRSAETSSVSLEVLKLEKQIAEKQLTAQKSRGELPSPAMIQRYKQCQQKIVEVETMLASGNRNVLINYIRKLQENVPQEHAKAQQALKAGNKSEAQLCLTRRKLMENEISSLKRQLGIR
ncbi:PREDICTED: coiled-coil and C2 domain-containing protein 1-like [Acropora digitifera]|uniref:coiled-coil and C2 domain-containing protein 1-like n=1 Tax=Acropora digitifera TaxID=70779 RepID=UPI00077AA99C|nr:PREDICTED: coiled-coil and C2 domain-containing protein 1-like [Acropora digitifera]